MTGETPACPRDQLAKRNEGAGSPMREGLHAAVSLAEFVALVAVLETLREKTGPKDLCSGANAGSGAERPELTGKRQNEH